MVVDVEVLVVVEVVVEVVDVEVVVKVVVEVVVVELVVLVVVVVTTLAKVKLPLTSSAVSITSPLSSHGQTSFILAAVALTVRPEQSLGIDGIVQFARQGE